MASRYQLLIVDLDKVAALSADAQAALASTVILRRTGDPDQEVAIEDEVARESSAPRGDRLKLETARRFLNSPSLMKHDDKPDGPIWRYHQRRTGIDHKTAAIKGFEWLMAQPDASDAPPPGAETPTLGAEA